MARTLRSRRGRPFVELSLTLFELCRRLDAEARRRPERPLLFLAREGRILREAFERYQHHLAPGPRLRTEYLYVSRRSTFLASLRPIGAEDFGRILELYPRMSTGDLLASMGLDPDDTAAILADLDQLADLADLADVGRLGGLEGRRDGGGSAVEAARLGRGAAAPVDAATLRRSAVFVERYEARRHEQRRLLLRYLEQVSGRADGPLSVVDVGWKGTMQDHLQAVVGPDRPIEGFYLGLVSSKAIRDGDRKHGLLFDTRGAGTPMLRVFRHYKSLYELFLQADHGSVQAYRDHDGTVEPVLDVQPVEAELFREIVGPVQAGVLDAFDELCRLHAEAGPGAAVPLVVTARHHARMLFFPTGAELDAVLRLRHFENFGEMGYVTPAVEPVRGWRDRAAAMADVARRPGRLLVGTWPPLELDALGLRGLVPMLGAYRYGRELLVPMARRRLNR